MNKGEIKIYKNNNWNIEIETRFENETVWLNLNQISFLFQKDKSNISRHIKNIIKSWELSQEQTVAFFATVQNEWWKMVERKIEYFNLDMIISIWYRVNSKEATSFRVWATSILKEYLQKWYAINENKVLELKTKFNDLKSTILFLEEKSNDKELLSQSKELLSLIWEYSKTLTYLQKFDEWTLEDKKWEYSWKYILSYEECKNIIKSLKKELINKKEASELFWNEKDKSFEWIVKTIYQTFDWIELYDDIESKASNLLYFIIKDHPFSDWNKRLWSFIFIYFLDKNNYLYKNNWEIKINDNALTTLALLVASSKPQEKEIVIKLIKNLISN